MENGFMFLLFSGFFLMTIAFVILILKYITLKNEFKEARRIAIMWWFLPRVNSFANPPLYQELEPDNSEKIKEREILLEKIEKARQMAFNDTSIGELKETAEGLRDLYNKLRFE